MRVIRYQNSPNGRLHYHWLSSVKLDHRDLFDLEIDIWSGLEVELIYSPHKSPKQLYYCKHSTRPGHPHETRSASLSFATTSSGQVFGIGYHLDLVFRKLTRRQVDLSHTEISSSIVKIPHPTLIYSTITYLYYFNPLKPPLFYSKTGVYRCIHYVSYFAKNIDCGYLLEPPRWDCINEYPQSMFWAGIWIFMWKFSFFVSGKIFSIFE